MNTNTNGDFHICTCLQAPIKLAVVLLVALVAVGCLGHRNTPALANATTASELDVIVALLKPLCRSSDGSRIPLVIMDTFSIEGLTMGTGTGDKFKQSLLSQASDKVPADLISDFCAKNAKPQPVPPDWGKRLEVVLCSQKELEKIFAAGPGVKPDGWDKFYAKHHKSPGIITISRVGFNRRGDLAMVYFGHQVQWLAGNGQIRIFRKQDGRWVAVHTRFGPSWVS